MMSKSQYISSMGDTSWVDARILGEYVQKGRVHFDCVHRSSEVFRFNTLELQEHLHRAESNVAMSMSLMTDVGHASDPSEMTRQEYWIRLDQRLQNMLSSAIALVDHTRCLVEFYGDKPSFQAEFTARNDVIRTAPEFTFLREFRNFLLHHGIPPMQTTLRLKDDSLDQQQNWFEILLSSPALLDARDWTAVPREFIKNNPNGIHLSVLVRSYSTKMGELYSWLFAQYSVLHVPGVPPQFTINQ